MLDLAAMKELVSKKW
ncbi:UNVERIFIED_CONTAM: hypothetical protein GTU68_053064 [Idotea baltica]|nr:hypothetical protein [Idotea baltica]MCL4152836.1 hypothetical protein [Idotea baltica]